MQFSAALTALRTDAEAQYGKPLRLVTATGWPPFRVAEASVADDGTPVITVNGLVPLTEDIVAHELLHLKLRAQGFPILTYEGQASLLAALPLIQMDRFVYDPIEHYMFQKQMKQYGYDLSKMRAANLKNVLALDDLEGPKPPERLVAFYFGHALELGTQHKLVIQAGKWFKRKGWSKELKTARRLVGLVTTKNPATAEDAIDLFIGCLNTIFESRARFSVKEWTNGTKGSHRYREVVIFVDRPA